MVDTLWIMYVENSSTFSTVENHRVLHMFSTHNPQCQIGSRTDNLLIMNNAINSHMTYPHNPPSYYCYHEHVQFIHLFYNHDKTCEEQNIHYLKSGHHQPLNKKS
jgi:hypothetical protein